MKTKDQWIFEASYLSSVADYANSSSSPEYYSLIPQDREHAYRHSPARKILRQTLSGFTRHSNLIPPHQRLKLHKIAQLIVTSHRLGQQPIRAIHLVGHADRDLQRGANFERKISGDRALAVQQALIHSINNPTISSRIHWQRVSAGASQLIVQNPATEKARARNRRVTMVLSTAPGNKPPSPLKWTTRAISISILKAKVPSCMGTASPGFVSLLSRIPDCVGTCGGPIKEHFKIFFHVDADIVPRPQPFLPPTVSVELEVLTPSGSSKFSKAFTDMKPAYQGPGKPLLTNFGENFIVPIAPGDLLRANLQLTDPSSGVKVIYVDQIKVVKLNCS